MNCVLPAWLLGAVRGTTTPSRPWPCAAQVLVEPRHDLDEIARPVAVVERAPGSRPGVAAGARRARQTEDVSGAGDASGRAGLDRRPADLLRAHHHLPANPGRRRLHRPMRRRRRASRDRVDTRARSGGWADAKGGQPRGSSKTAREIARGALFERSILGHDGDGRLAPVEPPVQAGAENIVLQTDLAWSQEGPTVG